MAIKLADTLAPMADFPAVMAEHTAFEDGETLQEKYETGQLGGGSGGYTQLSQAEYDALTDDEKMNGKEYRTYDTGHIYRLGVEFGKDADISRSEVLKTYVSLYNLNTKKGLSLAWENNVDNTQKIIDALEGREEFIDSFSSSTNRIGIVGNYGTTINNFHIIKRSADLAIITATTNAGTILNRTYTNGTLSDWCVNIAVYTSLEQLGLTADAIIEDVVNALKSGESFLAPVNTFTNYETIFPNKVPNDKWNKIHIIKGDSLPSSHIRCFSQSGTSEYLANINNTNVVGWNDVSGTYIDISDAIIEKLGNEILKYPVGKYRINSTTTGNKFIDLPSDSEIKCGIIEVNGTAVGKTPFTDTWVYRMYKFECLTGTLSYVRRLNSGATAGQIEVDSGWREVGQQTFTSLSELGLTADATFQDVIDKLPKGGSALLGVTEFTNYQTIFPYEEGNDQFARVRIVKGIADGSRMYARWFRKDGVKEAIAKFSINTNKFDGWQENTPKEILHTSLSGNLAGITTVLDLVNAMLTEYRAISPKKPIRFVSGEFTKTTLTDLPVTYGLLQITVAGWDVIEVRLAHSANGFKTMYYGFVNRISGEESISSITWEKVATSGTDVALTTLTPSSGITAPTGITITDGSKVNYCIRNGICYVHIALQISSISAKVNSWTVIAELPKSVIEAVGAMNCEGNTIPDCMPIRVSQAGKLTLMYKGTTTSTSDWWGYSFSYPVAE